jgi:hypothetical protein
MPAPKRAQKEAPASSQKKQETGELQDDDLLDLDDLSLDEIDLDGVDL